MAETDATQNDGTYNVVFITEDTPEFMEYIDLASQYIKSDGGNVKTNVINNYEIVKPDSIEKFDVSSELLRVIEDPNYDKNTKTYIFLIFDEKKIFAKADTSIQLKNELDDMETERPYISFISNMSEYNDNGFLAKLTSETDNKGIVINTDNFGDEKAVAVKDAIIEYLGISLSQTKIISSIGLTTLPMDFSEEKILDYYQEYKSGNGYYLTDTDDDGLGNFKEIAFDSKIIKFNPDLVLPTIAECRAYVIETENCVYVEKGWDRFIAAEIPQTLQYILSNVRILPIKSDPFSSDGDEDGILDIDEFVWNGIDERYENVSPLKADTVESLYYDDLLKSGSYNSKDNPISLEIHGNNILINIRYSFNNDDSETTKEELIDGAKYVWSHSYDVPNNEDTNAKVQLPYFKGKLYDFYPGMEITVRLNFIETDDNSININIYDRNTIDATRISSDNLVNWYNRSNSIIHIYPKQISDGSTIQDERIPYYLSHEIGHAMGLGDAYGKIEVETIVNDGFGIYTGYTDPNLEFSETYSGNGTFYAGEIMASNGLPCTNDVEMILQAFCENRTQLFYADSRDIYNNKKHISKAIKNPTIIYRVYSSALGEFIYFRYDRDHGTYPSIGNIEEMLKYVDDNIKA
jgi:hypothetical protein